MQFELLVIKIPNEIRATLASSTLFDVTAKFLNESFVVKYSPNGSNYRTKEEAIVYYWFEYISDCAENPSNVSVQEILKFFSGSSKMPASGFDGTPKIQFCNEDRLPSVSTCDLLITFPRPMGLLSYQDFKQKMTDCILGSYGFRSV